MQDSELFLIHYYLQKGISDEFILNLSPERKAFYSASAELTIERENAMFQSTLGASK